MLKNFDKGALLGEKGTTRGDAQAMDSFPERMHIAHSALNIRTETRDILNVTEERKKAAFVYLRRKGERRASNTELCALEMDQERGMTLRG